MSVNIEMNAGRINLASQLSSSRTQGLATRVIIRYRISSGNRIHLPEVSGSLMTLVDAADLNQSPTDTMDVLKGQASMVPLILSMVASL